VTIRASLSFRCSCARFLRYAGLVVLAIGSFAVPAAALDKVSLQLKWKHQFQFAGYYMALENGFYRDAGLDVEIREGGPGIDAAREVEDGKADFGVCTTSVLLAKPGRPKLVVLGVVFQHSAAVILTLSRSRISTPSELKSRWLMDTPGSDDLAAMLKREGVDYSMLPRVKHDGDPIDLIDGKADAMVGYVTNEPYLLEQRGVPYRVFAPRAFGIDFYGDAFCTAAQQLRLRPDRTRAFREATLKGWSYALAHKEEAVDVILQKYSDKKSRGALLFEASRTESLVRPDFLPVGSQSVERWQKIADTYRDLGMLGDARLPERLIYDTHDQESPREQTLLILSVAGLLVVILIVGFAYLRINGRLGRSGRKPKLSAVMGALFVFLSIPILIFILAYNHYRNAETILGMLQGQVTKSRVASIQNVETLFRSVSGVLGMLAEAAAAQPTFFRTENSRETLYRVLTSSTQIDAAYVSFDDGYHRVVTRVDDDRRRSDPNIPATANWHSSYVDDFSVGAQNRRRYRTFFDVWPNKIAEYSVPSTIDIRTLPGYAEARDSASLFVTEAALNPDTGYPIIYARVPIYREGTFLGCATVNITFDVLSQFLAAQRPSPNSQTIIADAISGAIIASSDKSKGVRVVDGKLQIARLENIEDVDVREAHRLAVQTNRDEIVFNSPRTGQELSASFARFTESYGHPWQWMTLTPTDDFVGQLKATNQQIILMIAVLSAIELLLIFLFARRLSQPIEDITRQLESVEALSFGKSTLSASKIREIARLQSATTLLSSSLQSFSSFAPVDLVRGLVKSGVPLSLGVESRRITVLFSDLEGFSTHAERLNLTDLLQQTSVYFEQVSKAISDEKGTVDKFIGDGVMAFWNAPVEAQDHALHACAGALRALRRMEAVNETWRAEGKSAFRIRIGINCDNSLVGNIGASDRFSYTAIGDGVNVAARLEGINKQFGTSICISDSVVAEAGPAVLTRPLRTVQVKGRKQRFMIYELLGITGSDDPELAPRPTDARLAQMTTAASEAFERGDRVRAASLYRAILDEFPDDPVARAILESAPSSEISPAAGG
jgi:class 3 adenylate cyclase/ABC-type nitrate/sulfonate/bicarbonate transport system substrate-binding protein